MNVLYDAFAVLGGFALLGLIFWWIANRTAPWGYQDKTGWHPGTPPKDEESE